MKLSNWSVVLATSIIVDSNSTSEDISNYFPQTSVSQNDDKLENLGLGTQGNKSGKIFCHDIKIMSSYLDLSVPFTWAGDPSHVEAVLTSWDLWGTQPGVFHVSLSLKITWSQGESQLYVPSLLRGVSHAWCLVCPINNKSQSYRLLEISPC